MEKNYSHALAVVIGLTLPSWALANCGSAFCLVNTDWNVQGVYTEPGARAELRYEYLKQDRLRSGSERVARGETHEHHDEISTRNQALFATFDYNFASGWGVSAVIPVVKRDHEHIHNHLGAQIPEEWNFTELADVRITGRYQFSLSARDAQRPQLFGVLFGVKLPTGSTTVKNDEGEEAERSLQPGTGTTDAIVGAYYHMQLPAHGLSWFAQATYTRPLDTHHDFRPGEKVSADIGMRYQASDTLALLLQLNTLWRGHDVGEQAEPEDSAGIFAFLSPGVSLSIGRRLQLFGLVQLPLYQYVEGLQLTSDWGATAGISYQF
ncbi:MAG TPA: hypothetical protein VFB54_20695 [Burkholderiales bacterium]|nr:hypothetical protein [Burkholderiales bacterium]